MDDTERLGTSNETGAETSKEANLVELGRRLAHYRQTRTGQSIGQIANLTHQRDGRGITKQTISRVERGSRQSDGRQSTPDLYTLVMLAEVYRLTEPERDEILRLAGYDPTRIPQLPPGELWDLPDEVLHRLAGRIEAILQLRERSRREQEP